MQSRACELANEKAQDTGTDTQRLWHSAGVLIPQHRDTMMGLLHDEQGGRGRGTNPRSFLEPPWDNDDGFVRPCACLLCHESRFVFISKATHAAAFCTEQRLQGGFGPLAVVGQMFHQ